MIDADDDPKSEIKNSVTKTKSQILSVNATGFKRETQLFMNSSYFMSESDCLAFVFGRRQWQWRQWQWPLAQNAIILLSGHWGTNR